MGAVLKSLQNLIFDIGAHKGDDTAVYLQLGYNVVAIEANTILLAAMKQRFKEAINSNRLILLNYAIAEENHKKILLYLSDDDSQSSLIKKTGHAITVVSRTLESLMIEYGVPYFCKIDIEGSDYMAIHSLSKSHRPPFISVEISGISLETLSKDPKKLLMNLNVLASLGYTKFKLVDQERLITLRKSSFYKNNLRFMKRVRGKILTSFSIDSRSRFLKKFCLEKNAEVSGQPAFLLAGEWSSYEEIKKRIEFHFNEYSMVVPSTDLIFWVDLHAAL